MAVKILWLPFNSPRQVEHHLEQVAAAAAGQAAPETFKISQPVAATAD
jgi:hypothetical protein